MARIEITQELENILNEHGFQTKRSGDRLYIEKLHTSTQGQLSLFPLNARVGKKTPAWLKLGFDRPPTFHDH